MRIEPFDGEVLLYRPESSTGIWLNPTAALVWGLCDGQRTIADIVALVVATYPAVEGVAQHTESALVELSGVGAIDLE